MAQRDEPIDITEFQEHPRVPLPLWAQAQGAGVARVAVHLYTMVTAETDSKVATLDERIAALEALCFGHTDG